MGARSGQCRGEKLDREQPARHHVPAQHHVPARHHVPAHPQGLQSAATMLGSTGRTAGPRAALPAAGNHEVQIPREFWAQIQLRGVKAPAGLQVSRVPVPQGHPPPQLSSPSCPSRPALSPGAVPFRRGSGLLSHLSPNKWEKQAPGEGGGPLGSLQTVTFGCRWPWSIPAEMGSSRAACPSSCPAPSSTAGLEMPPAPAAGRPGWDRAAPKCPRKALGPSGCS